MRSDVFIAKVAHGAIASAIATFMATNSQTSAALVPMVGHESAYIDPRITPAESTQCGAANSLVLSFPQSPTKWDKKMEREFRQLAFQEARGQLTTEKALRLAELDYWRERLVNPSSPEEILIQIKRDRILDKMQEALKEYVEFQESTSQKRPSPS
jgi:hypothetical protein